MEWWLMLKLVVVSGMMVDAQVGLPDQEDGLLA